MSEYGRLREPIAHQLRVHKDRAEHMLAPPGPKNAAELRDRIAALTKFAESWEQSEKAWAELSARTDLE